MNTAYYVPLFKITEYLTEDKRKAEYVLNCFLMQDEHDMDEMRCCENSISLQEKFSSRMDLKTSQMEIILDELTYFKNDIFRKRVAELLQWSMLNSEPLKVFDRKFPQDLRLYLKEVKRYEGDLAVMAADVNRRFKFISPKDDMPPKFLH